NSYCYCCEAGLAAKGTQRVAYVVGEIGGIILEAAFALHLFSHGGSDALDSAQFAKLSASFLAGGFSAPALRDQFFGFGLKMEGQLFASIGGGIGAEEAGVAAPDGLLVRVAIRV